MQPLAPRQQPQQRQQRRQQQQRPKFGSGANSDPIKVRAAYAKANQPEQQQQQQQQQQQREQRQQQEPQPQPQPQPVASINTGGPVSGFFNSERMRMLGIEDDGPKPVQPARSASPIRSSHQRPQSPRDIRKDDELRNDTVRGRSPASISEQQYPPQRLRAEHSADRSDSSTLNSRNLRRSPPPPSRYSSNSQQYRRDRSPPPPPISSHISRSHEDDRIQSSSAASVTGHLNGSAQRHESPPRSSSSRRSYSRFPEDRRHGAQEIRNRSPPPFDSDRNHRHRSPSQLPYKREEEARRQENGDTYSRYREERGMKRSRMDDDGGYTDFGSSSSKSHRNGSDIPAAFDDHYRPSPHAATERQEVRDRSFSPPPVRPPPQRAPLSPPRHLMMDPVKRQHDPLASSLPSTSFAGGRDEEDYRGYRVGGVRGGDDRYTGWKDDNSREDGRNRSPGLSNSSLLRRGAGDGGGSGGGYRDIRRRSPSPRREIPVDSRYQTEQRREREEMGRPIERPSYRRMRSPSPRSALSKERSKRSGGSGGRYSSAARSPPQNSERSRDRR
ncbi:hypothetical protein BDR26DRAFT_868631 [Obelidium mucronatum]|nr:hypothetical protein BDR26DRAFT_868631 [Obelidium mucronatum]